MPENRRPQGGGLFFWLTLYIYWSLPWGGARHRWGIMCTQTVVIW